MHGQRELGLQQALVAAGGQTECNRRAGVRHLGVEGQLQAIEFEGSLELQVVIHVTAGAGLDLGVEDQHVGVVVVVTRAHVEIEGDVGSHDVQRSVDGDGAIGKGLLHGSGKIGFESVLAEAYYHIPVRCAAVPGVLAVDDKADLGAGGVGGISKTAGHAMEFSGEADLGLVVVARGHEYQRVVRQIPIPLDVDVGGKAFPLSGRELVDGGSVEHQKVAGVGLRIDKIRQGVNSLGSAVATDPGCASSGQGNVQKVAGVEADAAVHNDVPRHGRAFVGNQRVDHVRVLVDFDEAKEGEGIGQCAVRSLKCGDQLIVQIE